MTRIEIPENVINELKTLCQEKNLGMSAAGGDGFAIIMIGDREQNVDRIALLCAHTLIEGILTNGWTESEIRVISDEPDRVQ